MKYSFYINSKSALDKLRILFKRIKYSDDKQQINSVNELYIDSKLLFSNIKDDKVFVNIFKIEKNISVIPHGQLLYYNFSENDFNEDDPTNQLQEKIDYLNNFYEENEDKENIYYKYSNDSFLKYSAFYSDVIQKINIDQESSRSSLLKFLKIDPPQRIHLTKKIAPFIFLENSNQQNIQTFDKFFERFDNLDENFDSFLLYSPLSYIKNIDTFYNKNSLSKFKNIILWLPDFNEISASIDEIRDLRIFLRKLYEINNSIIYLFGGMMIGEWFSNSVKEVICRTNIYPGYRIIPTKKTFGRRKKNMFFPQFGRTTKLESIAAPPYIHMFECNCISCSDFHKEGKLKKKKSLESLDHSSSRLSYHNYHSFMIKLEKNEKIEQYPNQVLDKIKLGKKWRKALNE